MIRIDDLSLFCRTAALGSFSLAAREIDLAPGQVSAAIKRLEDELGIRLFARSTRSLRLTAEGEQYLPYALGVLQTLRDGYERLKPESAALRGPLQISAPSDLGRNVLLPLITDFCAGHPELILRLSLSDQISDVFKNPADIALRYGQVNDASFVALPVAPENRRVLFASPEYVDRYGSPQGIEDLGDHACLIYAIDGRPYDQWEFPMDEGSRFIRVKGSLQCDDADIVRRWALSGHGIGYKSWLDVCDDVCAGRLLLLLPEQAGRRSPLNLICPHRKQMTPAVQQLYARLRQYCEQLVSELRSRSSYASNLRVEK